MKVRCSGLRGTDTRRIVALFAVVATLGAALGAPVALAGNFGIAPVRVELDSAQRTAVLTVHNNDDGPLTVQVTALTWSQAQGVDQTQATQELLVTPPIFTLPAHGEQVLRIALRAERDARRESAYRLMLTEVPAATDKDFNGLRMALRISVPVFILPAIHTQAQVQWRAEPQSDGKLAVSATNSGSAHLQVTDFNVDFGAASASAHVAVSRYVLPGSTVTWTVTPPTGARLDGGLSLRGSSDQGDFRANVAIASH